MKQLFLRLWTFLFAITGLLAPMQTLRAAPVTALNNVMSRQLAGAQSTHRIRFITPSGVGAPGDTITLTFDPQFTVAVTNADVVLTHGPTGIETTETMGAAAAAGVWGVSTAGDIITLTPPTDAGLGEISPGDEVRITINTSETALQNPGTSGEDYTIIVGGGFGDSGSLDVPIVDNDAVSVSVTVNNATGGGGGGGGGCLGLACTDFTPPTLLNVRVVNITTSTALVLWETDEPANTFVEYGFTTGYASGTISDGSLTLSHSALITGLDANTLYHLRVRSTDAAGNSSTSADITFTTLVINTTQQLVISNVQAILITDTTAVITWNTNLLSDSKVDFGLTTGYGMLSLDDTDTTSHVINLSGLNQNTVYHFKVTSETATLATTTQDYTFTTLRDLVAPANPFSFSATAGNQQNTLSWSNPLDPDFSHVRILARTDRYPQDPNDGALVYQGNQTTALHSGLVASTNYKYTNFAYDRSGNRSSGAITDATPFGDIVLPPTSTEPTPTSTLPNPPATTTTRPSTTSTEPLPTTSSTASTTTPPVVTSTEMTPTSTEPVATSTTSTVPATPTTTTKPIVKTEQANPDFSILNGTIDIIDGGRVDTIPGQTITIRIPAEQLKGAVESAMVRVGNDRYLLTKDGNGDYVASFVPPTGDSRAMVEVTYQNGNRLVSDTAINSVLPGFIYRRDIPIVGEKIPMENVRITLYVLRNGEWVLWSGMATRQANPIITVASGRWGFAVENGQYRVVVEREGYETITEEVTVTNNRLGFEAEMRVPTVVPEAAAVIATVATIANVATAASLLNYLWYLLTQPFLFFGARKRKKWGVVYNAITKQPVDLAAVRLIHAQTGLVLQTRVSDANGRFYFHVKKGQYKIDASKTGYQFPSETTKDLKEDDQFLDVYHGQGISVDEESDITVNIPLDPSLKEETPRKVIIKHYLRKLQGILAMVSVLITLGALIYEPSWLLGGLFAFQLGTYMLFRKLVSSRRPKNWGIVSEEGTKNPLERVVMRIYDRKYNKLLETQVTDGRGRYGFLANKNIYFITADKPGFERFKSDDIDLSKAKELTIEKPVKLKRKEPEVLPKV